MPRIRGEHVIQAKMMKPQVISTRIARCHCTRVNGRRSIRAAIWPWNVVAGAVVESAIGSSPVSGMLQRSVTMMLSGAVVAPE